MPTTIKTPPITIRTDGTVCSFNAAYNNVYIDLQRKDTTITAVANHFPNKFKLTVADASIFSVNGTAYIELFDDSVLVLSGNYNILEVNVISNFIVIDTAFFALTGVVSGFANTSLRTNYKMLVRATIQGQSTTERGFHANTQGVARVYLKSLLTGQFDNSHDIDYTEVNQRINGKDFEFYLSVKEEWFGYYTGFFSKLNTSYRAVKAIQQINSDLRLTDFEIYFNGVNKSDAKFLTAFVEPHMWIGKPFSVGCLFGIRTANIEREVTPNAGSIIDTPLEMSEALGINAIMLPIEVQDDTLQFCHLALKVGTGDNSNINDFIIGYINDYYL